MMGTNDPAITYRYLCEAPWPELSEREAGTVPASVIKAKVESLEGLIFFHTTQPR